MVRPPGCRNIPGVRALLGANLDRANTLAATIGSPGDYRHSWEREGGGRSEFNWNGKFEDNHWDNLLNMSHSIQPLSHWTPWRILRTRLASYSKEMYNQDLDQCPCCGQMMIDILTVISLWNYVWEFNTSCSRGLLDDTQTTSRIIHPELKDLFITIVTTNPCVGFLFSWGDVCLLRVTVRGWSWGEDGRNFECSHTDPSWGGGWPGRVSRSVQCPLPQCLHIWTLSWGSLSQLPG